MEGVVQSEESGRVKLKVGSGVVSFSRSAVKRIERATPEENEAIEAGWDRQKNQALVQEKRFKEKKRKEKYEEELKPKTANVYGENGSIYVNVVLNKKTTVSMVLDTGCSTTLLSYDLARRLNLPLKNATRVTATVADGRKVTALRVHLDSVRVDKSEARYVEANVLLPTAGTPQYGDGLLGMSFLKFFTFKVDYQKKKLTLERLK